MSLNYEYIFISVGHAFSLAWDQFDNAARVAALGAGMVTPAKRLRPPTLAKRLEMLATSAAMREHCAQLAAHFLPRPDLSGICTEIDRLVGATVAGGADAC